MKNKQEIFKVPEGYFDSLQMRLSYVPERVEASKRKTAYRLRVGLVAAQVAICLALAAVPFFVLHSSDTDPEDSLAMVENFYNADIIPLTDPDMLYDDSAAPSDAQAISDEDIVNYLIDDGVTVAQLEQFIY